MENNKQNRAIYREKERTARGKCTIIYTYITTVPYVEIL